MKLTLKYLQAELDVLRAELAELKAPVARPVIPPHSYYREDEIEQGDYRDMPAAAMDADRGTAPPWLVPGCGHYSHAWSADPCSDECPAKRAA